MRRWILASLRTGLSFFVSPAFRFRRPHRRVNYQVFCVFIRSSETLADLTDLKGKRVAVNRPGSAARVVAEKVLAISGVTSQNSTLLSDGNETAIDALIDRRADAAILGLSSDSPLIQSLLRDSRVQLVSITRAEALTRI